MEVMMAVSLGIFGITFYFLPTISARGRVHFQGIFLLNLLLGWTILGWVGALIWAVSDRKNIT